ncbi:protein spaetzle-like [Megachile rotundata]|uniref:protein spaetzle-like n=1 Tax=Megachile rotundata TaxID=143995 RepID=UPI00061507B9|nr:PREDICTED: protein spaetzle-like [Megachile rotundata]
MAAKVPPAIWIATVVVVFINVVVSSPRLPRTATEKRSIDGRISINDNNSNRKERSVIGRPRFNQDSMNADYTSGKIGYGKQREIVFPDQLDQVIASRSENMPQCNGQLLCEDVPNYPTGLVDSVIEKYPGIRRYQIDDTSEFIKSKSNVNEADQLCMSYRRVIYPKLGQTVTGDWMYIVNTPNFTQGVLVELCQNEGTACSIINGFALNYVTTCKQKYIFRELYAMSGSRVDREPFKLAASCCCHVGFSDDEGDR